MYIKNNNTKNKFLYRMSENGNQTYKHRKIFNKNEKRNEQKSKEKTPIEYRIGRYNQFR
jgi:hypothetical protein